MNKTQIEKLRDMVKLFDSCDESFAERYTMKQLEAIYDAYDACKWCFYPDQWSLEQVKGALRGIVPTFEHLE